MFSMKNISPVLSGFTIIDLKPNVKYLNFYSTISNKWIKKKLRRPLGEVKVRHSIPGRFTLAVRKAAVNGTMPLARIFHDARFFLCQTIRIIILLSRRQISRPSSCRQDTFGQSQTFIKTLIIRHSSSPIFGTGFKIGDVFQRDLIYFDRTLSKLF